ncbi:MAG: hypothetical protein ACYCZC_04660, partial [Acidithiobacillus sp.]
VGRDKASLDLFWLRDESLEDADNLPAPELILQEIMADLEGALAQLREMAGDLGGEVWAPERSAACGFAGEPLA